MGVRGEVPEIEDLLASAEQECDDIFTPTVCHRIYDIRIDGDTIDFGDFTLTSHDLAMRLAGCERAILFVATVGFGIDRLIKKHTVLSPARALALSAIGTAQVECLCDAFCQEIGETHGGVRPRFGVGYGDLSLNAQSLIFSHLQPTRHIGVTLNDSMLMSPAKSVSAILGIGACSRAREGCAACQKSDCQFRGSYDHT